jgi:shikimate dehydrogenase
MNYKFAVIGNPIEKSRSPQLFTEIWTNKLFTENLSYKAIQVKKQEIPFFLKTTDLSGFNVTSPLKELIISYLDDLTPIAKSVRSVNTVVRNNNEWIGHNTDGFGFWEMAKKHLPNPEKSSMICILGNGGAARSIVNKLDSLNYQGIILCRNKKGGFSWPEVSFESISEIQASAVIQCTNLGMHPNLNQTPESPIWLGKKKPIAIDLVYNPTKTRFLKKMESQGCEILNGSEMLIFQAKKAWQYWADVLNISQI